ncbi:MAG: alpha-D-ribose 1-methylphosphonate 5-phosphate C-P-lyase PhnJ [Spirochaetes bacterium]|nr:alpha-D-ribose 1-methylphosphonate 5-phosphate C-P-lyase PhnJ [Spirochaetota bacterium]
MNKTDYQYNFAFLDENTKREIRRCIIKAVCIPGFQVPFASRELPIFFGWGTGGLQITLSVIGKETVLKVIDQGDDDSVNAVNLKRLIISTTNIKTTEDTKEADIIQSRHRITEDSLTEEQIYIFQVPLPEPLRKVEPKEIETRRMHGEKDYGKMYVKLYEDILHHGEITIGADYPALVNERYIIATSPIPRWDVPRLNLSENLFLFGAGRERKIYAVPPYTKVEPLSLEDYPFRKEDFSGKECGICGSRDSYLNELPSEDDNGKSYVCSDSFYCRTNKLKSKDGT